MWEDAQKLFSCLPHSLDINFCDISKSGIIATCSSDRTIRLWKLTKTGLDELKHSPLTGHSYSVNVIKFSSHGTLLASASTDGSAVLWDVRTGEKLLSAYSPSGFSFRTCALSPDSAIFAAGGDDDKVHMWNVATKELERTISEHEATVNSISFSPDGQILVSCDMNGKLYGWSGQTNHSAVLFSEMEAHDLGVMYLDFSSVMSKTALTSFYTLASCGSDGLVKLWNIEIGTRNVLECIKEEFAHVGNAMCVKFSYQGDVLATSGGDKCVKIWSYPELTCLKTITGFTRYVTCCSFNKSATILIATSKKMQVWSRDGESSGDLSNLEDDKNFREERFNLQLTKNRKKVELIRKVGVTSSCDVTTCDIYKHILAVGSTDSKITLWKLKSNTAYNNTLNSNEHVMNSIEQHERSPLVGHTYSVYSLKFSKSGLLVSASLDGDLILWDPQTGDQIRNLKNPKQVGFRVVCISDDGNILVAGGDDDIIHVWYGQHYTSLKGHDNTVFALDLFIAPNINLAPDEATRILVSGSSDETLKIWDLNSWPPQKISSLEEVHDLGITCCAFQPNNSEDANIQDKAVLATGGNDSAIRIWWIYPPYKTFKSKQVLLDHGSSIMNMTYSNSGQYLGTAAGDRTARIWETKAYRCLYVLDEHERYVTSCSFSVQNSFFVTASENYIKLWKVEFTEGYKVDDSFHHIPIQDWSNSEVVHWLKSIGMDELKDLLKLFSGQMLLNVSQEELKNMGMQKEVALKLIQNIQWFRHGNIKSSSSETLETKEDEVPTEFLCPITYEIMENPVSLSDGFIYDEMAIKEWLLTRKQTSPMTNLELTDCRMTPCPELKDKIQLYLNKIGNN